MLAALVSAAVGAALFWASFQVRPSRDGSTGENSGMAPYLGGGVDFAR